MSTIFKAIDLARFRAGIAANLKKKLFSFTDTLPELRVETSLEVPFAQDVVIVRRKQGLDLLISEAMQHRRAELSWLLGGRLAAMVYWQLQAQAEVERMTVHLSDGDHASNAGFFFSTNLQNRTPVPDVYFFRKRGFADLREAIGTLDVPWAQRSREFVWRGGANGNGFFNFVPELAQHPATCQRVRMAWACQESEVDFGFVPPVTGPRYAAIRKAGFLRDRVAAETWFGRKYAIDIDGFSNTWDNLFHRMLMGCCVLKVESEFGFRQWYYDRLVPWCHFVPVKADLSDLHEKIAWVKDNDRQAEEIARAARALALSLDFGSVAHEAGQLIEKNWERHL